MHYDTETEGFTIETVQNLDDILDENQARRSMENGNWRGDMHHVAQIPNVILMKLHKEGILRDKKRFLAWLNERDNQAFRTRRGHL